MKSETARIAVNEMWAEGLKPTFDDIVRLNALGLRVDRGETSTDFATLPRQAFVGDLIFTEPTIAKRMWLDLASNAFRNDFTSQLMLTAYALNVPFEELPPVESASKLKSAVEAWRDRAALTLTESELLAVVDYVLRGADVDGDEYAELSMKDKAALATAKDIPAPLRSEARAALARASGWGIATDLAERATLRHLEGMIARAMVAKGKEYEDAIQMMYLGEFNRTADAIRLRLIKERDNHGKESH